jgi:hypothetical protein
MISMEFGEPGVRPILDTNLEHPLLLSVIIMRDPISRLLAGDGRTVKQYPGYQSGELNHTEWWKYASNNHNTDNFFLKKFTDNSTHHRYKNITKLAEKSKYTTNNKDNDNGSRMLRKNKNKNKNNNENKNKNKNNALSTLATATATAATALLLLLLIMIVV